MFSFNFLNFSEDRNIFLVVRVANHSLGNADLYNFVNYKEHIYKQIEIFGALNLKSSIYPNSFFISIQKNTFYSNYITKNTTFGSSNLRKIKVGQSRQDVLS